MSWFLFQLPEPEAIGTDRPILLRWIRLRRNGTLVDEGQADPGELSALLAAEDRPVALLPGERAPLHRVFVPGKSDRVRREALPFALEDRISEDLEKVRIVSAPRHGTETPASVAARRDLEHWENWLRGHSVRVSHMIPDVALLRDRVPDDQALLLVGSQRSILLSPGKEPLAMPREVADWWAQRTRQAGTPAEGADRDAPRTDDHVHVVDPAAGPDKHAPLSPPLDWSGGVLELLLAGIESGAVGPPELRRAVGSALVFDFASSDNDRGSPVTLPTPWRVPAALAGALAALWLGSVWLEAQQLESAYRATERDIEALFETTLPGTRMVDPVAQFETRLDQPDSATTAPDVESPIGDALARIMEALAPRELTLQRLRGDPDRLELELEGSGIAAVEQLREDLRESLTADVRIVAAESGEQGIEARIAIDRSPEGTP